MILLCFGHFFIFMLFLKLSHQSGSAAGFWPLLSEPPVKSILTRTSFYYYHLQIINTPTQDSIARGAPSTDPCRGYQLSASPGRGNNRNEKKAADDQHNLIINFAENLVTQFFITQSASSPANIKLFLFSSFPD